jgi:ferredoxin
LSPSRRRSVADFAADVFSRDSPCNLDNSGAVRDERGDGDDMKVWIDQDLCTGDGLCEEIAPDVFTLLDDGLAYVKEGPKIYAAAKGNAQGAEGLAEIPDGQLDAVIESAEECPGECIFIEQ